MASQHKPAEKKTKLEEVDVDVDGGEAPTLGNDDESKKESHTRISIKLDDLEKNIQALKSDIQTIQESINEIEVKRKDVKDKKIKDEKDMDRIIALMEEQKTLMEEQKTLMEEKETLVGQKTALLLSFKSGTYYGALWNVKPVGGLGGHHGSNRSILCR